MNGHGTIDSHALDAGDKVDHYLSCVGFQPANQRVIEETDAAGMPPALAQTVYPGSVGVSPAGYMDAPVCRDRNTEALYNGSSPDSDCLDSGGSQRYFNHQHAISRVVMLTDESGVAVERYDYDAYGEPRIWAGVSVITAANETRSLLTVSRNGSSADCVSADNT